MYLLPDEMQCYRAIVFCAYKTEAPTFSVAAQQSSSGSVQQVVCNRGWALTLKPHAIAGADAILADKSWLMAGQHVVSLLFAVGGLDGLREGAGVSHEGRILTDDTFTMSDVLGYVDDAAAGEIQFRDFTMQCAWTADATAFTPPPVRVKRRSSSSYGYEPLSASATASSAAASPRKRSRSARAQRVTTLGDSERAALLARIVQLETWNTAFYANFVKLRDRVENAERQLREIHG